MKKEITVGVVENHPLFLLGLELIIKNSQNFELSFSVASGHLALVELEKNVVDILFVDLEIPMINGAELIKIINREGFKTRIIVISNHADAYDIRNAFKNGARAFCSKDCASDEIIRIMNDVINTNDTILCSKSIYKNEMLHNKTSIDVHGITPKEFEIITLLSKDYSTKEIASQLSISIHTVHSHRKNILRKLQVKGNIGIINAAKTGRMFD